MTMNTAMQTRCGLVTKARLPHLHYELNAGPENIVEFMLTHPANVQLLDPVNYADYCAGKTFHYYGGHSTFSPLRLQPPRQEHWHIAIDLGGGPGSVSASIRMD